MLARGKLKRKQMSGDRVYVTHLPQTCGQLFLDSGAHALYTKEVIWKEHANGYDYYESRAFKEYVDGYAKFLIERGKGVDFYANVDVIFRPDLSWKWLKYLEGEYGLSPVPVIHYGTPLKWVAKHLDAGYEFLGIGGLGQEVSADQYFGWADSVYAMLCPGLGGLPIVRTHGFAMTSYRLMVRYPWWSVDSVSWAKAAGFGSIFVPHKRGGRFTFEVEPYVVAFSHRSEAKKVKGRHFEKMRPAERKIVLSWLEEIGVGVGAVGADGRVKEYGAASQYHARAVANLKFFDRLCDWLPPWPWPFKVRGRSTLFGGD